MAGTTRILARHVVGAKLADLPEPVRHEGRRALVNYVGCALGGCTDPAVDILHEALDEFSGPREATLFGRTQRADIFQAARWNGLSSALNSFNDTHFSTVAHPTSAVLPAIFALAERRRVTGADFLAALILGIELHCRLGMIVTEPPATSSVALSMVGLTGGIGAAIATARLMGLDETATAWAIGHAANQACGLREQHASMSGHFTSGHAAASGLLAAILAGRGFHSNDTVIEGPKGFGAAFAQDANFGVATEGLGSRFEILSLAYKPYPSGFVIHPALDACLAIAREERYQPADIERIEVLADPLMLQLCNRPTPQHRLEATVSFQHWVAVSLARRAAGLAEGATEAVRDPLVVSLRAKVGATADPALGREAAQVTVRLSDGRALERRILHSTGTPERPMTDAELEAKFMGQATFVGMDEAAARQLLADCWRIDALPDAATLAAQARFAAASRHAAA